MQMYFEKVNKSWGLLKGGCYLTPGFIFILISTILVFRNTFPLAFPTLYAEDGVWIGKLFFNGYIDTALHARNEFPVVGLVSLLWLALKLNGLLFQNDISQISSSNCIVSAFFRTCC